MVLGVGSMGVEVVRREGIRVVVVVREGVGVLVVLLVVLGR